MKRLLNLTQAEVAILTWLLFPNEVKAAYMVLFSIPFPDPTPVWRDWATLAQHGLTERRWDATAVPPRVRLVVTDEGLEALHRHYRKRSTINRRGGDNGSETVS